MQFIELHNWEVTQNINTFRYCMWRSNVSKTRVNAHEKRYRLYCERLFSCRIRSVVYWSTQILYATRGYLLFKIINIILKTKLSTNFFSFKIKWYYNTLYLTRFYRKKTLLTCIAFASYPVRLIWSVLNVSLYVYTYVFFLLSPTFIIIKDIIQDSMLTGVYFLIRVSSKRSNLYFAITNYLQTHNKSLEIETFGKRYRDFHIHLVIFI